MNIKVLFFTIRKKAVIKYFVNKALALLSLFLQYRVPDV